MKTSEELKKFYEEQLLPDLKTLDSRRKKIAIGVGLLTFATVLVPLFVLAQFVMDFSAKSFYLLAGSLPMSMFFSSIIWFVGHLLLTRKYARDFKDQVIRKIVKFVDSDLNYESKKSLSISSQNPSKFEIEDYTSGMIGKTRIEFYSLSSEYTEITDSRGRGHKWWYTPFKGIFFIADFNKKFKGTTAVFSDIAERYLGKVVGSKIQSSETINGELVKLEDPEFEKTFVVYSDDQVEARYILSTSLMQRILEFKKKTGRDFSILFVDNTAHIAISYYKNLLEPRIFRSLLDFKQVEQYFHNIKLAVDVVEDLNLNTRIWGKE
ncbi:MAG: DUF3137 domain-containing protein [Candidatus Altiarchaeota archaeon]